MSVAAPRLTRRGMATEMRCDEKGACSPLQRAVLAYVRLEGPSTDHVDERSLEAKYSISSSGRKEGEASGWGRAWSRPRLGVGGDRESGATLAAERED